MSIDTVTHLPELLMKKQILLIKKRKDKEVSSLERESPIEVI